MFCHKNMCKLSFLFLESSILSGRPSSLLWVMIFRKYMRPLWSSFGLIWKSPCDSVTASCAQPHRVPKVPCSSIYSLFLDALATTFLYGQFLLLFTTIQVLTDVWSSLTTTESYPELHSLQHFLQNSSHMVKKWHLIVLIYICLITSVTENICFFFFLLFFLKHFYLFIYLFLAVLGLRFCARALSSCGKWGPLFITVRGPLTIAASLVVEHRLQTRRLSSCGSRA